MLAPGASFASYEVLRRLAVGGMGEVYLCRHRLLDRLDAVKVLRPHLADQADFRRRFLREALSVARLRHPHVVTVYTADEADGLLYLAMEYVAGEDLAAVLARGRLEPGRTVALLAVVADALDAAHRASLVHRDIKPSNLLVTAAGQPQESVTLVDFGISRRFDTDTEITRTGEIVGTIAYCAPEQLARGSVDGACDQYALACVAYECLTGSVPFPRESQLAMVSAHLTVPPPAVTAARPGLPAAVDAVVARAMAKRPEARYPSCGAFVTALSDALALPPPPGPAGVGASGAAGPGEDDAFPSPESLLRRLATGPAGLVRAPGDADWLAVRAGWGRHGPLVLPLAAGPVGLRGESGPTARLLGWLLGQAAARHSSRHLCLIAALAPAAPDTWLWVGWLAHARPSTPPIAGAHLATTEEAAADLVQRLRALLRDRASGASGAAATGAGAPGPGAPGGSPQVLAVLDGRLGARLTVAELIVAARAGVHVVQLEPAGTGLPPSMSTLDLSADLGGCRWERAGYPPADGVPDHPSDGYGREIGELLPDG